MNTITRKELIEAVTYAAKSAESCLMATDSDALIRVADTTTRIAAGDYVCDGVGCPATQAGLWREGVSVAPGVPYFTYRFDIRLQERKLLGGSARVLDVID